MGILKDLRVYRGKWAVKSVTPFDAADAANVESAKIVPSEFGQSVCMTLKSGGTSYMPVSNTSREVANGEEIDITKVNVVTLGREGDNDIYRAEIQ